MICPTCKTQLSGLALWCHVCGKYLSDMEAEFRQGTGPEGGENMTFHFPLPANIANARLHWARKHRAKMAYWDRLDTLKRTGRLPAPPEVPVLAAEARDIWFVWNVMDEGNARARLKWVEDWLVTMKYLADDKQSNLTYPGPPEQHVDRRNPKLVLVLAEVKGGTDG